MHSYLPLFGVVGVAFLKRIVSITENNFRTGGNLSGKLQLNSHQKEQSSITMFIVLKIQKEESNQLDTQNGIWSKLILTHQEVMLWVTLQSQQSKH